MTIALLVTSAMTTTAPESSIVRKAFGVVLVSSLPFRARKGHLELHEICRLKRIAASALVVSTVPLLGWYHLWSVRQGRIAHRAHLSLSVVQSEASVQRAQHHPLLAQWAATAPL